MAENAEDAENGEDAQHDAPSPRGRRPERVPVPVQAAPPAGGPDPSLPESFPARFASAESGSSEPVIITVLPAGEVPRQAAKPGRAFVFSDREGGLVRLSAPPQRGMLGFGGPRYEWCFEVDTTLRRNTFVDSVPSRTELSRFELTVQAEWSVTDPAAVVRRGLGDAAEIVRARLLDIARTVGHRFQIEQVAEMETALAERFRAEPRTYDEGITVHRCYVKAIPDERTRHFQERFQIARVNRQLTDEEVGALRVSIRTSSDLFLRYLAQDPSRVGTLILDMRRHEEIKEERIIELYRQAIEQRIIQPAEVNEMLQQLRGSMTDLLQPESRSGILDQPAIPPAAYATPALPGEPVRDVDDGDDGDDEDVMPEDLRGRADTPKVDWRPMPWDS